MTDKGLYKRSENILLTVILQNTTAVDRSILEGYPLADYTITFSKGIYPLPLARGPILNASRQGRKSTVIPAGGELKSEIRIKDLLPSGTTLSDGIYAIAVKRDFRNGSEKPSRPERDGETYLQPVLTLCIEGD